MSDWTDMVSNLAILPNGFLVSFVWKGRRPHHFFQWIQAKYCIARRIAEHTSLAQSHFQLGQSACYSVLSAVLFPTEILPVSPAALVIEPEFCPDKILYKYLSSTCTRALTFFWLLT